MLRETKRYFFFEKTIDRCGFIQEYLLSSEKFIKY